MAIALGAVVLVTIASSRLPAQELLPIDTISIDCVDNVLKEKTMVIKSQAQFEQLNAIRKGEDCDPLPKIDFNKKIVLAYRVQATGCAEPTCRANMITANGELIVSVQIQTSGICRLFFDRVFWFVVDKPPTSANVRFQQVP